MENLNPVGGNKAREGAFSPTPHDLADKIANRVREELERIRDLERAVESVELAARVERVARKMLKGYGNLTVDYIFDEYPKSITFVREKVGDERVLWQEIESADILQIVDIDTNRAIGEIVIHYVADELQLKSKYYMKLKTVKEVKAVVGE